MERKTRIWLGLGAAVLVGSAGAQAAAVSAAPVAETSLAGAPEVAAPARMLVAQAEPSSFEGGEGGEGEGGEGGGQVLGTITEFRLGSTDPNAFSYDGSQQVEAYAALVHETYSEAHAGVLKLQEAVAALLAEPGEATLDAARQAWLAARPAYMRSEAYLFYAGPVDIPGGPIKRLNTWPVDPAFLDYVEDKPDSGIVNDPSIPMNRASIVRLDQAGAPNQVTTGWHAIEFLLWGEDRDAAGPGARPFADYVAGVGNNDRRRDYLRIVTQLLALDLSTLVAAWAPGTNNYRGALVNMDQRNAIGRAFNGMAVLAGYELALRRLSASLFPNNRDYEQSRFSDSTTADVVANFEGVRNVYFGRAAGYQGAGFDGLVAGIDPALNDRIVAAFDRAEAAVGAIDTPYDGILASPADSPARVEVREAVAALKDLAALLRAAGNTLGVLVVIPGV